MIGLSSEIVTVAFGAAFFLSMASAVLLLWNMNRRSFVLAGIDRLQPFYFAPGQTKSDLVICEYSFHVREKQYHGSGIVALDYFDRSGSLVIQLDLAMDISTLRIGQSRLAGDEAIEHYLLQHRAVIPVSFVMRNPGRNHCPVARNIPVDLYSHHRAG